MDECNACNSISGVYYALCDDCMTKLNQLQADHQRLSRLLSASESRESVLRDENVRLKEAFALMDRDGEALDKMKAKERMDAWKKINENPDNTVSWETFKRLVGQLGLTKGIKKAQELSKGKK